MKKNFSLYIILIPILAVLISITLITIHNIKELNATAKDDIKEFTKNYFIEEKTKIYNKVHFFSNIIKLKTDEFSKEQRNSIKQNVEKIDYFESYFLDNHNKVYSKKIKKAPALKELFKNNYINIIIDLDSKKILLDEKKVLDNIRVEDISDSKGLKVLNSNRKFNEFIEVKLNKNKYLFYIKKLKDSNLLILSGNDSKKLEEEIKQKVLKTLVYFDTDNRYYMFIMEIFNKDGGNKYGKVLLHQANPSLAGKFLNEKSQNKDMEKYRKDYLKIIRESGEGFITYNYFKPENNTISKKLSFFYLQKDWNWVIGSGFYFNDLESKKEEFKLSIEEKIKESVKTALLVGFLLILFISIALYFITSKINRLINNYATSLSESNENLKKQKDIFKTLFDKSSDGIIIYSENGLIINCNDSIEKMLGYDKSDIRDKSLKDFSPKFQYDKELTISKENLFKEVAFNNQTHNFEWLFLSKNKRKLFCEIRTTRLNLDSKNIVHVVIRDITYKKELETKTKRQQVMLAEESKKSALGEMLTMIAHQWRQPLNNINLLIHFVRDTFDSGKFSKEELKEITLDMKTQIEYLSNTINDFTNFTNPKKELTLFCVKDVITKTYNLAIAQFEKNNIKVFIESEEIKVYGIENEFMQVILNILNNSKDALLEVEKNRLLFINAKKEDEKLVLTIKDNAGGIPAKIIPRVFEPYFTTKHKNNGTGIGLYMSTEIIKQYKNGTIDVKNVSFYHEEIFYEGAMFTIKIDLD
ncbi:MAG: cache domain-containing protein [Arcobacter sp.]|uniref:cache domain-containing protein n=1 Tax=Arcobacter sp. TaxID=1872629 RepID=UPI003AFFF328